MSQNTNFNRVRGDEQVIFINTIKPLGIESLSIQDNFGLQPLNYIGIGAKKNFQIPNSEQYADVDINSSLIDYDYFIPYIQSSPINIYVFQDVTDITNNYLLLSGYLNTYYAKYSIGQIPQISTSFRFTEDAGKIPINQINPDTYNELVTIRSNYTFGNYNHTGDYLIPNGNSIELLLNEINYNRILNYDININVNRYPVYNISRKSPKRVDIIYPIEVTCQFAMEISNYDFTKLRDLVKSPQSQDVCLNIYSNNENIFMCGYKFKNMNLVSETYANSTNGNVTVNKQYLGYFNKQDNTQANEFNQLSSGNLGGMGILFSRNAPFVNDDAIDGSVI